MLFIKPCPVTDHTNICEKWGRHFLTMVPDENDRLEHMYVPEFHPRSNVIRKSDTAGKIE